jgi:hypothetical protein
MFARRPGLRQGGDAARVSSASVDERDRLLWDRRREEARDCRELAPARYLDAFASAQADGAPAAPPA